jgi:ATP synthase protein I
MPFNNPIPEDRSKPNARRAGSGGLSSLVQAEKLMQIAFVLPCAMVIGWGAGWCIDHFLHVHWATFAGLIFGIIAGMVTVIRMAMEAMNSLDSRKPK